MHSVFFLYCTAITEFRRPENVLKEYEKLISCTPTCFTQLLRQVSFVTTLTATSISLRLLGLCESLGLWHLLHQSYVHSCLSPKIRQLIWNRRGRYGHRNLYGIIYTVYRRLGHCVQERQDAVWTSLLLGMQFPHSPPMPLQRIKIITMHGTLIPLLPAVY